MSTPVVSAPALTPGQGVRSVLAMVALTVLLTRFLPPPLADSLAVLAVVLYYRLHGLQWRHWWSRGRWDEVWPVACLHFGLLMLALLASGVLSRLLPVVTEALARFGPIYEYRRELLAVPGLALLYVALAPAVTEEVLFRGLVLGALRSRGDGQAVLASALLFAVLHGPGFLPALAGGLILGAIVIRSGSLLPAMVLHFTHNALLFALALLDARAVIQDHAVTILILMLGLPAVGLWLGRRPLAAFVVWARQELALSPGQVRAEIGFLLRHASVWVLLILISAALAALLGPAWFVALLIATVLGLAVWLGSR